MKLFGQFFIISFLALFALVRTETKQAKSDNTKPLPESLSSSDKPTPPYHPKVLACKILQILKTDNDKQKYTKYTGNVGPISKERERKIQAMMVYKCINSISQELAEHLLENETFDSIDPTLEPYVNIDYDAVIGKNKDFDWSLTDGERELLSVLDQVMI